MMSDECDERGLLPIHHSAFITHHFPHPSVAAVVATAGLPFGTSTSLTWRRCFLRLKSRERQLSAARKPAATSRPAQPKAMTTPLPVPVRFNPCARFGAPLNGSIVLMLFQPSSACTAKMVSPVQTTFRSEAG